MKSRIMHLLAEQRKMLAQLGDERPTPNEQHKYLREIARRYQALAYHALNSPEELPSDEMKLRGLTRTAAELFADTVKNEGHLYSFQDVGEAEDIAAAGTPPRKFAKLPAKKADALYHEIRLQIKNNRGVELHGMTNPKVLKPLFNMQTSKWEELGSSYLTDVISTSADVAVEILDYVLKDMRASENTKSELMNIVFEFEDQARGIVFQRLRSFFHDKSKFPLQTNDESFGEKVKKAQQLRFKAALERYQRKHKPEQFLLSLVPNIDPLGLSQAPLAVYQSWAIVDVNEIGDLLEEMHPRGAQNTEDEIHDLLKAYYEVSPKHVVKTCCCPFNLFSTSAHYYFKMPRRVFYLTN
jgi:DNA-directed RNA polymerase subunit F